MKELNLSIEFATPAFLGNAEQVAQWRTPPFKTLIRQWWWVVEAPDCKYDHNILLTHENKLFGSASAEKEDAKSAASLLRLRLSSWKEGAMKNWKEIYTIEHPEVKRPVGKNLHMNAKDEHSVGVGLYMGYGPLTYSKEKGVTDFASANGESRKAIEPNTQKNNLWLAFPDEYQREMQQTLQLIGWFGTLGSRSRNGWGSLVITSQELNLPALSKELIKPFTREFSECLKLEWAHAIGKDSKGPLIWQTQPYKSWQEAMKELAKIKISYRTKFAFTTGKPHVVPCKRHVISYPITKHTLQGFGDNRLTNQLRFKVLKTENDKYIGLIVHLPCMAPKELVKKLEENANTFRQLEKEVWPEIHQILDVKLPNGRLS